MIPAGGADCITKVIVGQWGKLKKYHFGDRIKPMRYDLIVIKEYAKIIVGWK